MSRSPNVSNLGLRDTETLGVDEKNILFCVWHNEIFITFAEPF